MMNSISISTALLIISMICNSVSLFISFEYRRHSKSQCSPSSWLISSLLKHNPGIRPSFLSQKMAQKEPEMNIPSTVANTNMQLAKLVAVVSNHLSAHYAFFWMQETVSKAQRRCIFFAGSLMYVSMRSKYISLWIFSIAILTP